MIDRLLFKSVVPGTAEIIGTGDPVHPTEAVKNLIANASASDFPLIPGENYSKMYFNTASSALNESTARYAFDSRSDQSITSYSSNPLYKGAAEFDEAELNNQLTGDTGA